MRVSYTQANFGFRFWQRQRGAGETIQIGRGMITEVSTYFLRETGDVMM
jgi:hypothetical protein